MADIKDVIAQCDDWLMPASFKDYAPNGLQVSGQQTVSKLALAVTADLDSLTKAVAWGADSVLVHHGLFWRGQSPVVTGMMRDRLAFVLKHNINLMAYHLPLDAHATLGNNAALADLLGWSVSSPLPFGSPSCGLIGQLPTPMTAAAFAEDVAKKMGRAPCWLPGGPKMIQSLAWCSGAAQDGLSLAASLGLDAYCSGEVSERTYYEAKELGIHYFALGHHATEKGGVQRLGQALSESFAIECTFINSDNPI